MRLTKRRKVLPTIQFAAVAVLVFSAVAAAQPAPSRGTRAKRHIGAGQACFGSLRVARDSSGRAIVLPTLDLDQMAAERSMPAFPPTGARITGSLRMKVLIDASGRIRCATLVQGHPILAKVAVDTLRAWRFRYYIHGGKPTPVLGVLDYRFQASDPRSVFLDFHLEDRGWLCGQTDLFQPHEFQGDAVRAKIVIARGDTTETFPTDEFGRYGVQLEPGDYRLLDVVGSDGKELRLDRRQLRVFAVSAGKTTWFDVKIER
jgi:hypothetical protein